MSGKHKGRGKAWEGVLDGVGPVVKRERVRFAGLGLLFSLTAASGVAGQQDTLATLTGLVRSAGSGQPLADVLVSVRGAATGAFQVTDSAGRFRIARLPPGRYTLRLAYAGQTAEDYQVAVAPGRTLDLSILLDAKAVDLSPIVVEAAATDYALNLAGFYARKGHGFGRFVTRDDIDRRRPTNLSAMLSGTGITMRCQRTQCVAVRAGRRCTVAVFLDGVWVENYDIDLIPPEDVLGLEVYRQASDTPTEFSRSSGCGAIVIWTKN